MTDARFCPDSEGRERESGGGGREREREREKGRSFRGRKGEEKERERERRIFASVPSLPSVPSVPSFLASFFPRFLSFFLSSSLPVHPNTIMPPHVAVCVWGDYLRVDRQ
jgi:hypothetical protein